jgi:hypothetical protein
MIRRREFIALLGGAAHEASRVHFAGWLRGVVVGLLVRAGSHSRYRGVSLWNCPHLGDCNRRKW